MSKSRFFIFTTMAVLIITAIFSQNLVERRRERSTNERAVLRHDSKQGTEMTNASITTTKYIDDDAIRIRDDIKEVRYIRITLDHKLLKLPMVFEKVFQRNRSHLIHTQNVQEADVVFFERLTDYQSLYNSLPHRKQMYYSLACVDYIASKAKLYELLAHNLGVDRSKNVVPPTFLLRSNTDRNQLLHFANDTDSECLIFKSNQQQQKGLKIVRKKDILDFDHSTYVVAQKLLSNPYTIRGRKINLRQYVLITCDGDSRMRFYAYEDGFVYYAREDFSSTDFDEKIHVTTGLGDRTFYKENPLTIRDFQESLDDADRRRFDKNKLFCLGTVFKSIKSELQRIEQTLPAVKFNIVGVDLHVTRDMNVFVMEVNKGCDLTFKDLRDAEIKMTLVEDTMNLVLKGHISNFARVA